MRRFPAKLSLFYFALVVICLLLRLTSGVETVKLIYTAFDSLFVLISVVYLMAKGNEKSAEVWTSALTVIMWRTGILTMAMDYANTKKILNIMLLGAAGVIVTKHLKRWRGKGSE